MSSQNTLITCANDNEVKRPSGTMVSRQFYRDKSAQGSGIYKAMNENGDIEIIGGPGVGQINIVVSIAHNDGEATYSATPAGGTAPYSYSWTVVSTGSNGGPPLAGISGANTPVFTTNGAQGMVRVDVTDSNNITSSAYFSQLTPGA